MALLQMPSPRCPFSAKLSIIRECQLRVSRGLLRSAWHCAHISNGARCSLRLDSQGDFSGTRRSMAMTVYICALGASRQESRLRTWQSLSAQSRSADFEPDLQLNHKRYRQILPPSRPSRPDTARPPQLRFRVARRRPFWSRGSHSA